MTHQPTCLIVTGPPASGKSTLAQKLATHLDWPLIGRDAIREQVFATTGHVIEHTDVNHRFVTAIQQTLAHGQPLACEAAFQHALWMTLLAQLTAPHQIKLITCHVPADMRIARITQRIIDDTLRTDVHADPILLHAYTQGTTNLNAFRYLDGPWPHLAIDCQHGYQPPVDDVVAWVRRG